MKIAQVCARYYPSIGGVETHVKEISERLVQKGYNINVICTEPEGKLPRTEKINGVKIVRFKTFLTPKNKYDFAPGIYFYLKEADFDIIHAHDYHSFPSLFASFARKDKRFIFTPHYHAKKNLLHLAYKPIGVKVFEKSDKVICVSKYEMGQIRRRFKILESKLIQIPNGINLEEFRGIKPLPKMGKTLLYVGRFEKYKGVQYAIMVLKEISDYKLVVVGKGPYEETLRKLAYNLKVYDRIDWLKDLPRDELLRHYRSADVFLMLSRYESYSITTAEALASGTPCIVVKGSALNEWIDNESCIGIDYPIDADQLSDLILRLSLSNNRFKFNWELISWDEVTQKLIDEVYKKVI